MPLAKVDRRIEVLSTMLRRRECERGVEPAARCGSVRQRVELERRRRRRPVERLRVERVREVDDAELAQIDLLGLCDTRAQQRRNTQRGDRLHLSSKSPSL